MVIKLSDGSTIDNIKIDGTQADMWAKERTLQSLLASSGVTNELLLEFAKVYLKSEDLNKLADKLSDNADQNAEDLSDIITETGKKTNLESRFAAERYTAAVGNLKDSLLTSLGDIGSSLSSADPGSIFRTISTRLDSANRQFDGMNTKLTRVIAGLSIAANILEVSYERINNLNDGFMQAYSSGVKFAGGLSGLNQAVGESGMSMQEYIGIMTKYSQAFNVLGGRRVPELSKEFRALTNNGSSLTMTLAQSQEGLMAYADILRMSGRLQKMSDKDIAAGAKSYLESINELSYASGRAREELMASTRNALSRPEFQAFMATLSDGAKANLEKSITSLAAFGDEMQGKMSSFIEAGMAGGTAAMFKNNEALFRLAQQTGQLPQMMKIIEMAAAGQDVSQAMMDFTAGVENSTIVSSGQMARLAQFDPMFASMSQEFGKLMIETNNLEAAQTQLAKEAEAAGLSIEAYKEKQEKQSEGFLEANSRMQIAMTGVNSAFNDLLLKVIYPVLIPGMELLASVVSTLTGVFTTVSDSLSGLFQFMGANEGWGEGLGAAATVGGAAYLGSKAIGAVKNRLVGGRGTPGINPLDMLEGPTPPDIGRLGRLGEGLSGFGKGVGGLGRGVGDSIAGVMGGIAKGFKAFGDPKVLLGIAGIAGLAGSVWIAGKAFQEFATVSWEDMGKAGTAIVALGLAAAAAGNVAPLIAIGGAALGTAIAAIGAGLAGAAWMLGGTLPTLAEGIRAFTDIDGANLEKVGFGMLGIGGGLIAIGAGEVANAVGSFVGWIGSLFGAEDPIERLKRFGELGEPLGKAGPALDAFGTAFLNATAKMNAATLNDSVETSMEQIMRILEMDASGTFGGEPPIIGQINSLADAMSNLNKEAAELATGGVNPASTVSSPDMLTPSELQKRTVAFYDNQRTSNASIIELLRSANEKLDVINTSVVDDTNRTLRALKASSNNVN